MITIILFILFILVPFLCAAQLTPGQVLRVRPNSTDSFELFTPDYLHNIDTTGSGACVMTAKRATDSIVSLKAMIADKLDATQAAVNALFGYTMGNASTVVTNTSNIATNTSNISLKVNITDTGAMLAPYARTNSIPSITGKLNISDTAAMLANYRNGINANVTSIATNTSSISTLNSTKLNASDTASLSSRINASAANIATNTSNISTNTTDISLKKNITDSGRCVSCYVTNYDLNKVRDSVQANIPTVTQYKLITDSGRQITFYATGYDLNKVRDSITGLGYLTTATLPLAKADASTKGIATFSTDYFTDNNAGKISFSSTAGTGTVATSAVTINNVRGKITYNSPSIVAAGTATFTFTNSFVNSTSTVSVGINGNGSNLTSVNCYIKSQTSGSCVVAVQNLSLLNLFNSNMVIDFSVLN